MATVVDALWVSLGLDASAFAKAAATATETLDDLKDKTKQTADDIARDQKESDDRAAREKKSAAEKQAQDERTQAERQAKELRDAQDKARKEIEANAKKAGAALSSLRNQAIGFFAALIGARTVEGFFQSIVSGDAALGRMATNLDLSTKELAGFQFGAEQAGGSAQGITASIMGLEQAFQQFQITGQFSQSLAVLRSLGIDASNVTEAMSELNKQFFALAQSGQGQRALALGQMLGFDIGTTQFLEQDPAIVQKQLAKGAATAPSDADVKRAIAFQQTWNSLAAASRQFGRDLAEVVFPPLTRLLDRMDRWVRSNPPLLQKMADGLGQFVAYLGSIDWNTVITSVQEFFIGVENIVKLLGGWQKVSTDIIEIWVGAKVLAMIAHLSTIVGMLMAVPGAGTVGAILLGIGAGFAGAYESGKNTAEQAARGKQPIIIDPWGNPIYAPDEQSGQPDPHAQHEKGPIQRFFERIFPVAPSARAAEAINYFTSQGLSGDQAKAITANLQRESGLDPANVGDNGQAIGLAQWHPERQADIARHFGKPIGEMSYQEQLAAVLWEMQSGADAGARQAGQAFQKGNTAEGYSWDFLHLFERSADQNADMRKNLGILQGYDTAPQASPGPAVPLNVVSPVAWLPKLFGPAQPAPTLAAWQAPGAELTTGARAAMAGNVSHSTSSSVDSNVSIGTINVQTAATDAPGVARGIGAALKNYTMASQANFALV